MVRASPGSQGRNDAGDAFRLAGSPMGQPSCLCRVLFARAPVLGLCFLVSVKKTRRGRLNKLGESSFRGISQSTTAVNNRMFFVYFAVLWYGGALVLKGEMTLGTCKPKKELARKKTIRELSVRGKLSQSIMVVSRCLGIGPPSGIPPLGRCFCGPPIFVVSQHPPTRPSFFCFVGVPVLARGFCHSPRCFLGVFL